MAMTLDGTTGIVLPSGAAPAFSAWNDQVQNIASNTLTKLLFAIEEFDTNN